MGMLDTITGSLGSKDSSSVMSLVTGLITNSNNGGLAGLLQRFKAGGLGNVADSWVSSGENLPISAEQVQSVFGAEQIQQMASKAGIAPEALSGKLAELLPQVVDKVTPDGSIPDQSKLQGGWEACFRVSWAGRTRNETVSARPCFLGILATCP